MYSREGLENEDEGGGAVALLSIILGSDLRMRRTANRRWWILVVFLGWIVLAIIGLFVPDESPQMLFRLLLVQQILFIVGGLMGSRPETLRLPKLGELGKGILSGLGLFVVNTSLGALMVGAFTAVLGSETTTQIVLGERSGVELFLRSGDPNLIKGVIFLVTISAPISEELFFRGLLLDSMREIVGPSWATFTAALVFALLHFYVVQFIPVLAAGILLGVMFLRSGNIYRPMIAHSTANALALAALISTLTA